MARPTIVEMSDGLEARLATISGLRPHSEPVENPEAPAALVLFLDREPATNCGGNIARFAIELSVESDRPDWSRSLRSMLPYLDEDGTSSVEAAIRADKTLGGLECNASVTDVSGPGRTQFTNHMRWVAVINVRVIY